MINIKSMLIWLSLTTSTSRICADLVDHQRHVKVIDAIVNQFERPFTSIEILPGCEAHSLSMCTLHPKSVWIVLEGRTSNNAVQALLKRCCRTRPNSLILLGVDLTTGCLKRLAECEHFDLVIVLGQHGLEDHWRYLTALGEHLLIEIDDRFSKIQEFLIHSGGKEVAALSHSRIYHVYTPKNCLTRKTWLRTLESVIEIKSNFKEKTLIKRIPYHKNLVQSEWKPGINLITFKMCSGLYPESWQMQDSLRAIKHVWHNDWAMHNMVVQGTALALIDFGDPRMFGCETSYSKRRFRTYNYISQCLELVEPVKVEDFFWKYLKTRR